MSVPFGFAFLDEVLDDVGWDAKYATADNFTGAPVAGYEIDRIVVSTALAAGLADATTRAAQLGYGLVVWDAYRPQRAVDQFVEWSTRPDDEVTRARFHPRIGRAEMLTLGYVATRSAHTRGAAVDLTLSRLDTGELVEMGGRHDLMDERSHHGAPDLPDGAAHHRQLLCAVMEGSGFRRYEPEWWHYALRDEPYPDSYFDFPVTGGVRSTLGGRAGRTVATSRRSPM